MWVAFAPFSEFIDRVRAGSLKGLAGPYFPKALGALGLAFLGVMGLTLATLGWGVLGRQVPIPAHYLLADGSGKDARARRIQVRISPGYGIDRVTGWATHSVGEIFTMNFASPIHALESKSKFTPLGWAAFESALIRSKMVENVRDGRLDVKVVPIKPARVTQVKYVDDDPNQRVWSIQIPLLMVYTGASPKPSYRRLMCDIVVIQINPGQDVEGLSIAKLAMSTYNG